MGLLLFLFAMITVFSLLSAYFLSLHNLRNILVQSAVHVLVATGITMVMATRGIDLSVGGILALSSIVTAWLIKADLPVTVAIATGLLTGAGMGFANGVGVARLGLSPFIITLGTAGIFRAVSLIFTEARPIYGMPLSFRSMGVDQLGPIPVSVIIALAVVTVGYFTVEWTSFGINARAVGDNLEAALRMGVPVGWTYVGVYVFSGFTAALGGLVITARLNTAEAIAGWGIELEAIAAAVIGGTSFSGGEARILGTLLGALTIGVLNNGLTLCNVPSYYQQLVVGLVFVSAVLAEGRRRNVSGKNQIARQRRGQ